MELRQNGPRHQRPAETQEQDDERPTVSDDRTDTPPMPAAEVMLPTARHAVLVCALVEGTSEHGRTVACLTDTLDEVGISASYRAFVQHGTGVVHRLFGKGSSTYYRLEVDGPVESGSSFQLPVLIAHCLREAGRLYAMVRERQELDPQTSRELVWATGSVAPLSYRVGEVGHVAEKLAFSRAKFEEALAAGRTIRIFVPAGNQDDADRATLDWIREKGIAFHPVTSVDEVLDILKLPPIPRAASTSGAPAGGWQGNPYRGLDPFGPEHRAVFFGRGRAREEALDRLRKAAAWGKPFLAITGRSGVGKSSLAMAGLAGDVEAASGPGFRLEVCRPSDGGAHPAGALAAAILRLAGSAAGDSTDAALTALAAGTATAGRDARRLLIVDQLEELFAASVTDAEVAAFADLLDAAVRAGVWTIVTMRADAEGLVDRAPAIAKLASGDRIYRLDRPSRSEIAEIVEAPIAASGRRFADRRIPEGIADMAARSPDSLPLLQVMLSRLFEAADADGVLREEALRRVGTLEEAIGFWAEEVRDGILRDGLAPGMVDRTLASLVRIDRDVGAPLARSIPLPGEDDPERRVIDRLVAARIATVHVQEGRAGAQVRLSHEALFEHWPYLRDLVKRLALSLALRDDLEEKAAAWTGRGRDDADLIHGTTRIEDAEQFLAAALVPVAAPARELVAASRAADDRETAKAARFRRVERTKKVLERVAWGSLVAIAVAVIGTFAYLRMESRMAIGRLAAETGSIERAQTAWLAEASGPVLSLLPDTEGRRDLATRILDGGLVTTLVQWAPPGRKSDATDSGSILLTRDALYAYAGAGGSAALMRCGADGTGCEAMLLPDEWWSTGFYEEPFLVEAESGVVLVSPDARAELAVPATGPLAFRPVAIDGARVDRLKARAAAVAVDPSLPADGRDDDGTPEVYDCAPDGKICLMFRWTDLHGTDIAFDVRARTETGWDERIADFLTDSYPEVAAAFSPDSRMLAVSNGSDLGTWTIGAGQTIGREPDRSIALDERIGAVSFDASGRSLFLVTSTRLLRIDLDPRLDVRNVPGTGPGYELVGEAADGRRLFKVFDGYGNLLELVAVDATGAKLGALLVSRVDEEAVFDPDSIRFWPESGLLTVAMNPQEDGDPTTTLAFDASLKPVGRPAAGTAIAGWGGTTPGLLLHREDCDLAVWSPPGATVPVSLAGADGPITDDSGEASTFCERAYPEVAAQSAAGPVIMAVDRLFLLSQTAGAWGFTELDPGGRKLATLTDRDGTLEYLVEGEGLHRLRPDRGNTVETIPFAGGQAGRFVAEWTADTTWRHPPELFSDGGGRYLAVVGGEGCPAKDDVTLLLFEVSGETASPSAMVRCVRGHSAVTPTAHMIRSGETTWIGLDTFGGLIAWDGGDRLRLYDFRRTPLNALQPAAVAPEMKANAAGIPEIDLSGRVRSHALVLSALAVAPDGRSLAFVITGVFEPETPVGTPAWLGIFDVDAMSVTEFGAGNGLFAGNHALAYSRDGRLLLVETPEWGGLDIAVPAEERIFASIDEVITAAETAPGVISLTFRDGAKGTFALPEFGAGQTAALAARLASAPTVAVPPPEVPENPPGQPQAVVRAIEEFLSGDSGYSYPIVVDGIPDARIRNIVGSLLGTDKAADFDLDQRTLDRLRAEEAESMEGLGPDEESDDAPGDTDASVPPAGDGEPEDAE